MVSTQSKSPKFKASRYEGKKMTREQFLKWQPKQDEWKYEWHKGMIETEQRMKSTERHIVTNLLRKFTITKAFQNGDTLLPETDCWLTLEQMRRPDLAYFTKRQIKESVDGKEPIPTFVVELISPNDKTSHIENKLKEYFEAEVQMIWYIFPEFKQVKIYTSIKDIKVCLEDDICSAAPFIPDFEISVKDLFSV